MCQQSQGESDYIIAGEKFQKEQGAQAYREGKSKSENPNSFNGGGSYDYYYNAWNLGWDLAAAKDGKTIPKESYIKWLVDNY